MDLLIKLQDTFDDRFFVFDNLILRINLLSNQDLLQRRVELSRISLAQQMCPYNPVVDVEGILFGSFMNFPDSFNIPRSFHKCKSPMAVTVMSIGEEVLCHVAHCNRFLILGRQVLDKRQILISMRVLWIIH